MCIDFYDREWRHQPFHEPKEYPFSAEEQRKPANYDEMCALAEKLATDKPFSRIDFYDTNGKIFFGEITFYPTSGYGGFLPDEWDEILGEYIKLPIFKAQK